MKKEGIALIVWHFAQKILLADLILAMFVALTCYVLDLRTFEAYGTILVWAGMTLIILACITAIGGFASRTEDAIAFTRSGAGNMTDNLQRITDARSSNFGCFLQLLCTAVVLTGLGYLIQLLAVSF